MGAENKVKDIQESPRLSTLSKWEQDFIESIENQIEEGAELSIKQFNKLTDIHDKLFE